MATPIWVRRTFKLAKFFTWKVKKRKVELDFVIHKSRLSEFVLGLAVKISNFNLFKFSFSRSLSNPNFDCVEQSETLNSNLFDLPKDLDFWNSDYWALTVLLHVYDFCCRDLEFLPWRLPPMKASGLALANSLRWHTEYLQYYICSVKCSPFFFLHMYCTIYG